MHTKTIKRAPKNLTWKGVAIPGAQPITQELLERVVKKMRRDEEEQLKLAKVMAKDCAKNIHIRTQMGRFIFCAFCHKILVDK